MIVELGHYCLVLALFVALVQAVVLLTGAARQRADFMATATGSSLALFALVGASFAALTWAFVVSDFSVLVVALNSHTDKPLLYKISGVWANHEGSLLLWVLILTAFSLAISLLGRNLPPTLRSRAIAVQGLVTAGFLLFILFTSNPFWRIPPEAIPLNGQGLNPLLQDPALAFHPPLLYAGYVGFSMAFSLAVAALIEGRVDAAWARWVRPWTLAAWVFLTLGIALGAWWAYYELGWGGWWSWDPVENASFIPWLAGTALLHSAIVVEKRNALKVWTVFLAVLTFSLSLVGTFIVRSGVITSIHAFASDPTRGVFILVLLGLTIGASLILFAWRAPQLEGGSLFAPDSKEGSLLVNNLLMTTAAATVLIGVLYPLVADVLNMGKLTVGPPFYELVFKWLMIPTIVLMAIGPLLPWKRGDLRGALRKLTVADAAFVLTLIAVIVLAGADRYWTAIGLALGVWLATGTLTELALRLRGGRMPPRATWGLVLGHLGMAAMVIGIVCDYSWRTETVQAMRPGETRHLAGRDFTLLEADEVQGPNYTALRATVRLDEKGREVAVLHPERRDYATSTMPTTESAIASNGLVDYHAVIGESSGDGTFAARFFYHPGVPLLWYGAGLMALGGLISLTDGRYRVGAPKRNTATRSRKTPS
ncbi:heme lyase CcmF/NrfE family subunit [Phaeovibrio sulfidiphilus]|uniref:Heme lyase CcmF/NrfE family subunit n=1 Tax=Phaeovibrio sulfidiphilus TaxID=1220600 RepID=A0A8J6YPN6_9PROT|nr:heme lyase CcmF/NrfE family subunit [Phaeovibrio sulfidiphilus]MBE1237361.1 heme lyase CcmF/NrfE family subunit [Phaeovibrio sulfidiphilus]